MQAFDLPSVPPDSMTVRAGCVLSYEVARPTLALLLFTPRACARHAVVHEELVLGNGALVERLVDAHGNLLFKTMLLPGINEFRHDAEYLVPALADNEGVPVAGRRELSEQTMDILRYTLPSRYCESDKLVHFAHEKFGHLQPGPEQVQAICDWTHAHVEYRYGSGSSLLSACDVIERGYGVCRDFAHVMIALCRALDIPARYVAGHMPFLGKHEGDIGVDFHAYCEVHVDGHWQIYDARYNKPHCGRLPVAYGLDAVDAAIATVYGEAAMRKFEVWAYRVDEDVSLTDHRSATQNVPEGSPSLSAQV